MIKYLLSLILGVALIFLIPLSIEAKELEAGGSAMPVFKATKEAKFDYRIYTLRKFLTKYNSPLTPYSVDFIQTADYYGLDYRIVPAISGVESTFGKRIPTNSYNAYGWAGGKFVFKSWPDSITIVNKTLRKNYIDKGAVSISQIAKVYAPPSKTWGNNVKFFVGKINVLPLSFDI